MPFHVGDFDLVGGRQEMRAEIEPEGPGEAHAEVVPVKFRVKDLIHACDMELGCRPEARGFETGGVGGGSACARDTPPATLQRERLAGRGWPPGAVLAALQDVLNGVGSVLA